MTSLRESKLQHFEKVISLNFVVLVFWNKYSSFVPIFVMIENLTRYKRNLIFLLNDELYKKFTVVPKVFKDDVTKKCSNGVQYRFNSWIIAWYFLSTFAVFDCWYLHFFIYISVFFTGNLKTTCFLNNLEHRLLLQTKQNLFLIATV